MDDPAKSPERVDQEPRLTSRDLTYHSFTDSDQPAQVAHSQLNVRHEDPDRVMEMLAIAHGMTVADLGCGAGFYTSRLAAAVGESGKVYAVDADEFSIQTVRSRIAEDPTVDPHGVVQTVLCPPNDIQIPQRSLDVALMCHLDFHLFDPIPQPYAEFIRTCIEALKPGGRLLVVESHHAAQRWGMEVQGASIANIQLPFLAARLRLTEERELPAWKEGATQEALAIEPAQQGSVALLFERPAAGEER